MIAAPALTGAVGPAMVRSGVLVGGATGVVALVVGLAVAGAAAGASAAVGALLATVFFATGLSGLLMLLRRRLDALAVLGALLVYGFQLLVLAWAYTGMIGTSWLRPLAFAAGAFAAVLAWQAAAARTLLTSRTYAFEPEVGR